MKACYIFPGILGLVFAACLSCPGQTISVATRGLHISLSANGSITGIGFNGRYPGKKISGYTQLTGCSTKGAVVFTRMKNGGVEFTKQVVENGSEHACKVTERFYPTPGSIRWEVTIEGEGQPWSVPICTCLTYPADPQTTRYWTAWGSPVTDTSTLEPGLRKALQPVPCGAADSWVGAPNNQWVDPLVPVPFSNALYYYGAPYLKYNDPKLGFCPFQGNLICIPLISIMEEKENAGMSLVLSPEDKMQDLTLQVTRGGSLTFSRLFHRISGKNKITFSLDIIAHESDWRCALDWMSRRYPGYFNPADQGALDLAGTGAYSNSDTNVDVAKMKRLCFTTNWKASFDFPYMGMFLPPVKEHQTWKSFGGKTTSIAIMRDYAKKMKEEGFYVLDYFNVTEFGTKVKYPPPPLNPGSKTISWKDCNEFLYNKLPDAVLYAPREMHLPGDQQATGKRLYYSWEGAVAMDCGDSAYAGFLLRQAARYINCIPDASGICIDRLDWLRLFNEQYDDGQTWFNGKPVRSLIYSWKHFMERLSPVIHSAGKYIFVNNHDKRIDLLRHVDGIFDEFTYAGSPLNMTALLCVDKPALGWTSGSDVIRKAGTDNFFQKYLYMGVFPMAPFPGNDHAIQPDNWTDQQYFDYAPLMKLMQHRKWVLLPHVVAIKDQLAKANIFKVPQGYVIPVVYGGTTAAVEVHLKGLDLQKGRFEGWVYHPGTNRKIRTMIRANGTGYTVTVPLTRGCAMLLLKKKP